MIFFIFSPHCFVLMLLPDPFSDLIGSSDVAELCEIMIVEHVEQLYGRMITRSEFWEGFDWKLDKEYNDVHRPRRGRAWFFWKSEPIVRLEYELEPAIGSEGFEFSACRPSANRTKYHASKKNTI